MLTASVPRRVAILGGNRIPFARSNTAYAEASNQEMLTAALQGLADRYDLHGLRLGEVAAGAVVRSRGGPCSRCSPPVASRADGRIRSLRPRPSGSTS